MPNYWVTFRIHSDSTYEIRYKQMLDAMVDIRQSSWGEPTSFWLVSSPYDIEDFTAALARPLRSTTDLLVVRELSRDSSRYFGKVEHLDLLKSFLPNIKKLG